MDNTEIIKSLEGLDYQIVDAENPQHNQTIPADQRNSGEDALKVRDQMREDSFQRVAHNVRVKLAEAINRRRESENKRAARARMAKSRRKERLAKASRKRNRG